MQGMHPLRQSKNIRGILAQEIDVKGRYHAKILSTSTKHSKSCQVVPASQTTGAPTTCIAWSAWHPAGGPLSERKRSRSSRIWARNVYKSPLVSYSCFLLSGLSGPGFQDHLDQASVFQLPLWKSLENPSRSPKIENAPRCCVGNAACHLANLRSSWDIIFIALGIHKSETMAQNRAIKNRR